MEPQIKYAKTEDGVNIAYWTYGEGVPLVLMPSAAINPSRRAWQTPEGERWYQSLGKDRMLIRYDNRGFGDSQHGVTSYPPDFELIDLEAVVDRLQLDRFALVGYLFSGPVAIEYAAKHPDQVSRLLLWCTSGREIQLWSTEREAALERLREADWELYVETLALSAFGWSASEQARQYAQALRETMSPEAVTALAASQPHDVTNLLSDVRAPTLVLHRRGIKQPSPDAPRALAAGIPDARLAMLDGDSAVPYVGDVDAVLEAIDEFLGEGERATGRPEAAAAGDVHTILFTDMEGSTTLADRLGDAAAQDVRRAHNDIVRAALSASDGSEIKHTGDGIMASFTTASSALDAAIGIQRGVAEHKETNPNSPLAVYVGLNAGEPIAEDDDLFGTSVNLAARICDHAEAGQILAANVVRELAAGKDYLFSDLGETELRGFEDPVKLWELSWRDA